jgi:hypothetical protein
MIVVPAKPLVTVIPAKAGIHFAFDERQKWVPTFAGTTMRRV